MMTTLLRSTFQGGRPAVLAALALLSCSAAPALAGYQSASFVFNMSNEIGAGNYGTVFAEAYTGAVGTTDHGLNPGQVRFTVTAPFLSIYGSPADAGNYGMDKFSFNTNLSILASQVVTKTTGGTNLGWSVQFSKNISEFGVFSILDKGAGNSRGNPIIVTISGLGSNATLDHFVLPSTGNNGGTFFAAHVGGFAGNANNEEFGSHYIAVTEITHAPEPSGIALALAGLTGLGMLKVRRGRRGSQVSAALRTVVC